MKYIRKVFRGYLRQSNWETKINEHVLQNEPFILMIIGHRVPPNKIWPKHA